MRNREDYFIYGGIIAIIIGLILMTAGQQELRSYRWMSFKHRLKWRLYDLFGS